MSDKQTDPLDNLIIDMLVALIDCVKKLPNDSEVVQCLSQALSCFLRERLSDLREGSRHDP